jgi:hypothetical protein
LSIMVAVAAALTPAFAFAQAEPKYEFAKVDAPKPDAPPVVEWRAQIKGGALVTSGNSEVKSGTLGLTASRKEGSNRLTLDGALAYGRTSTFNPVVDTTLPMMPVVTSLGRTEVTSTNTWGAKGRYDRFFTTNNSGYASAQGAGDKIAGKTFFGGGQVGYSRQLLKNAMNLVVAELGYDFSYERYVQQPGKTLDPVDVHSARLFAGETLTLSKETGITASVEALLNVNKEGKALNHNTGTPGVDPLKDTRIIGKLGLTTTVWKALSVAFGFTLRYDQNPAPLPIPTLAPPGSTFAPTIAPATNGVPFAETLDTLTEATLIYTFL